jgi:hypothetical protein
MKRPLKLSDYDPATGHPPPAPVEYAGQWVAWSPDRTRIVGHGLGLADAHDAAIAAGHPDAILQHVRQPGVSFIGAT